MFYDVCSYMSPLLNIDSDFKCVNGKEMNLIEAL